MSWYTSDLFKRLFLLLVIFAAAVIAMYQFTPRDVVTTSASPTEFSGERAFDHLKVVAKEPHPMGSPANAAVRDYLIQEITAMGLRPEMQNTTAILRFPGANVIFAGTVQNIMVRLKGTASTRAILLDAHYDSADTGPGASDCGSCVVTSLETMRALKAGPPLKNDVIFVFSDGE
jgi:acetylornithine deacetylase/succinyl-diaminopimelate desuccinylase-like protein